MSCKPSLKWWVHQVCTFVSPRSCFAIHQSTLMQVSNLLYCMSSTSRSAKLYKGCQAAQFVPTFAYVS